MFRSIIKGSGSYIPENIRSNTEFAEQVFYDEKRVVLDIAPEEVVKKFKKITGIEERRYVCNELTASDIGYLAAKRAIENSGTDPELFDQLIVAHNFGNVRQNTVQSDAVPSLASHIKHLLGICSLRCTAYDVLFGCPGWIQALIQADAYFKAGLARHALVVGTETLSRVVDPYDRDSMIFSDGAGAVVLSFEKVPDDGPGILETSVQSHSLEDVDFIRMGISNRPDSDENTRFIKMKGRKVYEFAMKYVPIAMKDCLDKSGIPIHQLKKIFLHQANEKMDENIVRRFYHLFDIPTPPRDIMPMSIQWLGNSSVATVPTLYDLVIQNKIEGHQLLPGDVILFASVGAGMNINAICYRC